MRVIFVFVKNQLLFVCLIDENEWKERVFLLDSLVGIQQVFRTIYVQSTKLPNKMPK